MARKRVSNVYFVHMYFSFIRYVGTFSLELKFFYQRHDRCQLLQLVIMPMAITSRVYHDQKMIIFNDTYSINRTKRKKVSLVKNSSRVLHCL